MKSPSFCNSQLFLSSQERTFPRRRSLGRGEVDNLPETPNAHCQIQTTPLKTARQVSPRFTSFISLRRDLRQAKARINSSTPKTAAIDAISPITDQTRLSPGEGIGKPNPQIFFIRWANRGIDYGFSNKQNSFSSPHGEGVAR